MNVIDIEDNGLEYTNSHGIVFRWWGGDYCDIFADADSEYPFDNMNMNNEPFNDDALVECANDWWNDNAQYYR